MKKSTLLVALLAICQATIATAQLAPDSTAKKSSASILVGSNQQAQQANLLGSSITTVSDKSALHHNAGLNIINVLRGQSANFSFGASAFAPGGTIRGRSPLMVVDGFSYGYPMTQSLNMNAFEYEEISLIANSNAAINYGSGGLGSVIQLKSKTGEGYEKGQLEFNNYSTYGYYRGNQMFGGDDGNKVERWQFTNAVGYRKDFGIVDTRVSYAFSTSPAQKVGYNFKSRVHAIRVNTGFHFSDKFNARIILDDYYTKTFFDELEGAEDLQNDPYGNSSRTTLRANLSLAYAPASWFRLNGQASVNRIKGDDETMTSVGDPYSTHTARYEHQQGKFVNMFATFLPRLSDRVTMNFFVGAQREKYKPIQQTTMTTLINGVPQGQSGTSVSGEAEITSLLSGAGINFDDRFLIDLTYRREGIVDDNYDTYGATTAFIFAHEDDASFSLGKLRLSVAQSELIQATRYPYGTSNDPFYFSDVDLPSEGSNTEGGLDLGFINNRIGLSISYFDFRRDQNFHYLYTPSPWGGDYYLADVGKTATRGWETLASAIPVKTENLTYSTKLTWGRFKYDYDNEQYQFLEGYRPKWTMGLLNQLDFQTLYFSFLIDFIHADDINTFSFPDVESEKIAGSLTRLRDITVGYRYEPRSLKKFGIREMNFSLIGRNLWTIYPSGDDRNIEEYQNPNGFQKTVSLSATLVF